MKYKPAKEPNDLERFFVERVNAGDVEGLVALYEPGALLIDGSGELAVGIKQIREFFKKFLADCEVERMYGMDEIIPLLEEAGFTDISTANRLKADAPAQAGKHFAFWCRKPIV